MIEDLEEEIELPDGGKFRLWVGGSYFNAPVANGLGTSGNTAAFVFVQQTDDGAALANFGGSGGFEVWMPSDEFSIYAALDGDFVSASNDYTTEIGAAGVFVDLLPIDGSVSPGAVFVAPAGTLVNSTTDIDYRRINGALAVGWAKHENANIAFGVFGSAASTHLLSTVSNPADAAAFASLDETVSMYSVGPMIAGEAEQEMSDGVTGFLSGRAALLYAHGSLDATQTSSRLGAPISVTSDLDSFAGMVEAKAGVDFEVSETIDFTLFGGVGARNDYFSIVNPRSGDGIDANDPASYDPGPAHLQQDWLFEATLGVGIGGTF